jgi:hypothetical protein
MAIRKYQMLKRALGGKAFFWRSLKPRRERKLSNIFFCGSLFPLNAIFIFLYFSAMTHHA